MNKDFWLGFLIGILIMWMTTIFLGLYLGL